MSVPFESPLVTEAVGGDQHALVFLRSMASVMHTWDDLIDKDREVSDGEINAAFWLALVELPANPFYAAHADMLRPIVVQSILNWRAATQMEREATCEQYNDLKIAFIIRSTYIDLVVMSACVLGGPDWAAKVAPDLRRWAHSEGFKGYLDALAAEKGAREGE
jgi:hypothetical protein